MTQNPPQCATFLQFTGYYNVACQVKKIAALKRPKLFLFFWIAIQHARACNAAGTKDLRVHDLKHDFGTLLAKNDVDSFRRQNLLDNSDPGMSGKYAHWQPSMLNAIDAIEGKGVGTILAQEGEN
ncbi:MAG TPA: hypothetical protein VMB78_02480 [Dissulfurispiraceae bacterium]|nr:hypothetical protein [Dissulfurispiraceae bacterium]